jgi:hypothetical protein
MMNILEERQKNRWLLLQKMYEMSEGRSEGYSINMYAAGEQLGWNQKEIEATFQYLQGEGLVKSINIGGGIRLTHQGIREVEEAENNPDRPTLHFPSNIINIHGDHVAGDKVMGDKIGTQIDNSTDLTQAAQDIKSLLDRLSVDCPNDSNRVLGAKAIDTVDSNPVLKSRIINGLKAGGFTALEKMIDHPVAKIFVEGAKGAFK